MKYQIEAVECQRLTITFDSPEGLNKFTEFLMVNKIKGMGFEKSSKNVSITAFFNKEEMDMIKERYPIQ